MKRFDKSSTVSVLAISLALSLAWLGARVSAATSPSLGSATSYSILAGSQVTNTGATTISGDVGISPGTVMPNYTGFGTVTMGGTIHDADGAAATAQADKNVAYTNLASQGCDVDYGGVTTELAGKNLAPGVYCSTSFHLTSGTLTLNGTASGVWIFKSASDLIITGGASAKVVFTGGGLACNVWWRVVSSATFDANSSLVGNILADTSITFAAGASLNGRALARTAAVTLSSNSITGPTCTGPGTINVVKTVINDSGGTKAVADFPLFVNGTPVTSGATNSFTAPATYTVTETTDPNYTASFSGNCDSGGNLSLNPGDTKFCIVTNNDIGAPVVPPVPPLIDIVKVPSPLSLPGGPGPVTYTYTLRNIGTVPVTNITMVGDTCSPIVLTSGDSNSNSILEVSETWVFRCTTTLSATHTNTVVATGTANGITATDIASATVVVGVPVVPPLIHVTNIPSPLTLPARGGLVTYTETLTNPGTVALSDIIVTGDKCTPFNFVSGDTNNDLNLDPTETWIYTCQVNLSQTATNTTFAGGEANDLYGGDFAIATVVVASGVPGLPNTGFAIDGKSIPLRMSYWLLISY